MRRSAISRWSGDRIMTPPADVIPLAFRRYTPPVRAPRDNKALRSVATAVDPGAGPAAADLRHPARLRRPGLPPARDPRRADATARRSCSRPRRTARSPRRRSGWRSRPCSPRRSSSSGSSRSRDDGPVPGRRFRPGLAALVFPLEQHARRRAVPARRPGRAASAEHPAQRRSRGCSPIPAHGAGRAISPASGSRRGGSTRSRPTRPLPRVRRIAPVGDAPGDAALLPVDPGGGPQRPRLPRRRLHVRQRTPGAALRHRGRLGRRLPPGLAGRHAAGRRPDPGEHPGGDLQPDADLAGQAGQVDPREHPGHAARAAAVGRGGAARKAGRPDRRARSASGWSGTGPTRPAPRATGRMDPLGFALENFDAVGAWRTVEGGQAIDASGRLPGRSRVPRARGAPGRAPSRVGMPSPAASPRRCSPMRWAAASTAPTAAPSTRSSRRLEADGYRFSALVLAIVESEPFREPAQAGGTAMSRTREDLAQDRPEGPGRLDRPADAGGDGARTAARRIGRSGQCRRCAWRSSTSPTASTCPTGRRRRTRRRPRAPADPRAAARGQGRCPRPERADAEPGAGAGRRRRRPCAGHGQLPDRPPPPQDRRRRPPGRDLRRPARRAGRSGRRPDSPRWRSAAREAGTRGECDHGYSCAYQSNLSWRGESTPVAKQINPRLVFDRLFGAPPGDGRRRSGPRRSPAQERPRLRRRGRPPAQPSPSGTADRRKLDEYLTGVREIERRIDRRPADGRRRRA